MLTIILADSFESEREAIKNLLIEENYTVSDVSESSAVLALVLQDTPLAVVMAEEMPGINGVELLPLVRRLTSSPIVVIGKGGETATVKAFMQGADAYVPRPLNMLETLARIKRLLKKAQGRSRGDFDLRSCKLPLSGYRMWRVRAGGSRTSTVGRSLLHKGQLLVRQLTRFVTPIAHAPWSAWPPLTGGLHSKLLVESSFKNRGWIS